MKIWQKYLFGRLIRAFFFFLLCLFLLYIAVDFSLQGARALSKGNACWLDITNKYLYSFAKTAPLFLSLSYLFAMLRVLLDLGMHQEIVALQTAGLSSQKLLSPFFLFALFLALISYVNFQWILPLYDSSSTYKEARQKVFSLVLQDGSEVVYQQYDSDQMELFDVFWIRSFGEIWYMKTIKVHPAPPLAQFVEHFVKLKTTGVLERTEAYERRSFPEMPLGTEQIARRLIPFENRSLSTLFFQAIGTSSDKARSAAYFHYKLTQPLIPFLTTFSFAPFALRFTRSRSALLFLACCLLAFIALSMLFDAMLILAENQVASAEYAMWGPFAIACCVGYFCSRLR